MNKTILASLTMLLAFTAVAAADERDPEAPNHAADGMYLSLGYEYTQRPVEASTALFVDGGYRLSTSPLYVHGRVTAGATIEPGRPSDKYEQVRVGLEARKCIVGGLLCTFAGVDLGGERQYDARMSTNAALVVPRTGLELGAPFRFRFSIEAPIMSDRPKGLAGSFSVGYSF